MDHQNAMIEFERGTTVYQIMHGFSGREGRTIRIDGIKGEKKIHHNHKMHCGESGHGSGDFQLINGFYIP